MPCRGLLDERGRPWTWEQIRRGGADIYFSDPLPVLLSVEPREEYSDVSVTQLASDVRQEMLKLRHDYYESPESFWDRKLGSALHDFYAKHAREFHADPFEGGAAAVEERLALSVEVDGRAWRVGATPDYWTDTRHGGWLVDYKFTSVYSIGKIAEGGLELVRPDVDIQVRLYAYFLWMHGKPVYHITVRFEAKDYTKLGFANYYNLLQRHANADTYRSGRKAGQPVEKPAPYLAVLNVEIPFYNERMEELRCLFLARLRQWAAAMETEDDDLPICNRWENEKGEPLRCLNYCPVRKHCKFWREYEGH